MSNTREFRKNPPHALKIYSQFFLPMKNFLEGQIKTLKLDVDIDHLYPINEAWEYFCTEPISNLNKRKNRMKRKEAPDGHLKRPMSAYMWYINSQRESYVKKNPTAKLTEISIELSKLWRALTPEEKEIYEQKFTDDKERYTREREAIHDKIKEDNKDIPEKPKSPLSAYAYFMKDESIRDKLKAEHQKMIAEGINKSWLQFIPIKWKALTEKEKEKYEKLAADDTNRFTTEMETYNTKINKE